jgi:DNA-binding NtrC family response regulator
VLIWGETGTGKELIARSLRPIREDGTLGPFVSVDSATIMESTAESMLFGHEKGAFTGADRTRPGLFEQADGGVLFFDELANMPLSIQQKLLRVLQEKEVTRMGSERCIKLNFRIVAATNQDLEALVGSGKFQADLLQRLNVLPIQLPPLRERREDIESLVAHFLKKSAHSSTREMSPEALVLLQRYSWPGNIRELQNVIEYAMTMTDQKVLEPGDLPERIRAHLSSQSQKEASTFYEKIIRFERSLLEEALRGPYNSVSELATQLGMDRSHLYTKLKQHGLKA